MHNVWPKKTKMCGSRLPFLLAASSVAIAGLTLATLFSVTTLAQQSQQPPGQSPSNRHLGAIKSINGTAITISPDSGPDVSVTVQPTTRLLHIAPGEKDLKNATPIQLQDLHVGDRILVGGKAPDENSPVMASTIVVMTHTDIQSLHQQELEDWQKRGIDGLVTAVDAPAGTVTISVRGKNLVIQVSKTAVIRRYAPNSVKFDDAKPSTLAEIHAGDQVRARGERSVDGSQLTADEIVSGAFRNIAGTINSVDASSSAVNVHDLLSNKNVTVKIAQDSQLHQLPPEMAQRFAARLKRTSGGSSGAPSDSDSSPASQKSHPAGPPSGTSPGEGGGFRRSGGAPDLQQILSRTPTVALSELHKGDAVMLLSTEGSAGEGTAITLLTGVEPILQAAPNASGASILTPWSLGGPSGDAGGP
jgi:hypothetical protein